jgi:hypothetical protein
MSADPVTNLPHFRRSQLDDSEASLTEAEDFKGAYDIVVHRLIDHADLPAETIFGCVLTIPGTSYRVREESIYRHRGGREFTFLFSSNSHDNKASQQQHRNVLRHLALIGIRTHDLVF